MCIETTMLQYHLMFHALSIPSVLRRNCPLEYDYVDITTHGVK